MPYKKRLALYTRLSVEDGDLRTSENKSESNSITNQRKLLMAYIHSRKELSEEYDIVEFCDDGYSGTNFDRPRFKDMMSLVRDKQINCILVKDLSRFGREYLEVGAYLELILPLFGTRFISVNENFDSSNYIGTTGGLELALHNLINGMYSKDLSLKVRSAIKTKNRRGQYCGHGGFYGYLTDPEDKHHLIIDKEVSSSIRRIFDLCIEGKTTAEIAQKLNSENVPTPSVRKKQLGMSVSGKPLEDIPTWMPSMVGKILNDERYTGKMISGTRETIGIRSNKMRALPRDEWIITDGTHDAIISDDVFKAAQLSLKSRLKSAAYTRNGNGDLFVCGYCGRKLQKSYGKITHLFCNKARAVPNSDCAKIHEDMELLKSNVLRSVQEIALIILDKHTVSQQKNEIPQIEKSISGIHSRMEYLRNNKLSYYEDYRANRITKNKFIQIQQNNKDEYERLRLELTEYECMLNNLKLQKEQLIGISDNANKISMLKDYNPEIIGKLVERIRVFTGGRIELEMKCTDFL